MLYIYIMLDTSQFLNIYIYIYLIYRKYLRYNVSNKFILILLSMIKYYISFDNIHKKIVLIYVNIYAFILVEYVKLFYTEYQLVSIYLSQIEIFERSGKQYISIKIRIFNGH